MKSGAGAGASVLRWPAQPSRPVARPAVIRAAVPLLLLAIWLAAHPYSGLAADQRYYNIQFLHWLDPSRFADDIYFRYGSQDRFTLFTPAFAWTVPWLGLGAANLGLMACFAGLYLSGFWFVVSALFSSRAERTAAMVTGALLPGTMLFLHVAEMQVTPRVVAEALSLWAFGAMLRGRPWAAAGVLAVSACLHPLMTAPAAGLLCLYQARRNRWWIGAPLILGGAALALGAAGIHPFDAALAAYDPAWLRIVEARDSYCFVWSWGAAEWIRVATAFLVIGTGLAAARPGERWFLLCCVCIGLAGIVASVLTGDLLHLIMWFQAQPWRSMWIVMAIGNAAFGAALVRAWAAKAEERGGPAVPLALAAACLCGSSFIAVLLMPAPACLLASLACSAGLTWTSFGRSGARRVIVATLLGVAAILAAITAAVVITTDYMTQTEWWTSLVGAALVAAALAGLALPVRGALQAGLAGLVCIAALAHWDQRTPFRRLLEMPGPAATELDAIIPATRPVYWEGEVDFAWFLLRRPSWFSCDQGVGAMFSRGTAEAFAAAEDLVRPLGTTDFMGVSPCRSPINRLVTPITRTRLAALCQAAPELGTVVLGQDVDGVARTVWRPPAPYRIHLDPAHSPVKTLTIPAFYVYRCDTLREP